MAGTNETELKWYVVRALGGREKRAMEYLQSLAKRDADFNELVPQVLVPTEKVYSITKAGKKVVREKTLFPGYFIIQAVMTPKVQSALWECPHVLASGNPGAMSEEEANRLLGKVDELNAQGEITDVTFSVGESVVVTSGSFNTFKGTIEEVMEDRKRVKVIIKFFGRPTSVELSFFEIKSDN